MKGKETEIKTILYIKRKFKVALRNFLKLMHFFDSASRLFQGYCKIDLKMPQNVSSNVSNILQGCLMDPKKGPSNYANIIIEG